MAEAFRCAAKLLSKIENAIVKTLYFRYSPDHFAPALINAPQLQNNYEPRSVSEILQDYVLWAVPVKRRSIERRRSRRFGIPSLFYKMLVPKKNIIICDECGSYKEAGLLCPNCYAKVKKVTEEMQEAIQQHLGVGPVENEVVVLYDNDERENPEFYQNKRIVEIKKERPKLFCDNLLQKSTESSPVKQETIPKIESS